MEQLFIPWNSMYLVTAATHFELDPLLNLLPAGLGVETLLTGVGPVETAVSLTAFLAKSGNDCLGVINIGVAGAYIREKGAQLVDICLAERELLGDLGVCLEDSIESIQGPALRIQNLFNLDTEMLAAAETILQQGSVPYKVGTFVTVSGVTGTDRRGKMLTRQYQGLCENMEGAAAARACLEFGVPMLELRCISNLVEQRNMANWRMKEACQKCGEVAAKVVEGLCNENIR